MIVYVLKAVYGGYFNDYTTGYKLTYIKEREKNTLLYYDDNLDDFINFVTGYYGKHGLLKIIDMKRNNRKLYHDELKKLFEVGETK